MKKTITTIIAIFIALAIFAQKPKQDSVKSDTVSILSYQQVTQIIQDIQIQLSKKYVVTEEQWATDFNVLIQSIKIIPNKEQPKK
jgi:hypothetical protein